MMARTPHRWLIALVLPGLIALAPPAPAAEGSAETPAVSELLKEFGLAAGDDLHAAEVRDFARDKLRTVNRSLRKCLAALRTIELNEDVIDVLQSIARGAGNERFSSGKLAVLEEAAGTRIDLTENDVERCILAYDAQTLLEARTPAVRLPTIDCPPPGTICQGAGISDQICCAEGYVCAQECDEDGDCWPYCEAQLCFPGEATVRDETGATKLMKDVRIGDRLQVVMPDGSLRYEDVYLLTHDDPDVAGSFVELALASGQSLTLSPRHFIPTAPEAGAGWESRVLKGANEVKVGDVVWHQGSDGAMLATTVTEVTPTVGTGAFNPLTLSGTIVVDGVVASAHSDWFLDGVVSADLQGQIYQAMFAPVRGIYHLIGPEWTRTISEEWGVVDVVRTATTPRPSGSGVPWMPLGLLLLAGVSIAVLWRVKRAAVR